jgi:hypothetical protein
MCKHLNILSIAIFWVLALCSFVGSYQDFRETYHFYLQGNFARLHGVSTQQITIDIFAL